MQDSGPRGPSYDTPGLETICIVIDTIQLKFLHRKSLKLMTESGQFHVHLNVSKNSTSLLDIAHAKQYFIILSNERGENRAMCVFVREIFDLFEKKLL